MNHQSIHYSCSFVLQTVIKTTNKNQAEKMENKTKIFPLGLEFYWKIIENEGSFWWLNRSFYNFDSYQFLPVKSPCAFWKWDWEFIHGCNVAGTVTEEVYVPAEPAQTRNLLCWGAPRRQSHLSPLTTSA